MSKTTKSILIVEDSPTQAMHLQTLLQSEGLKVLLAHNGKAGVQLARQTIPDVIILDLEMPELNGFQVCQQLKGIETTADIPVILFTRHDDREAVVLGLQVGAIEFIPKDAFADAVLLETLRQMGVIET
ncbi:MAG: response regulator [Anaerolineae bacterium]|nr:response regulator [Anaerolineae bacterium]